MGVRKFRFLFRWQSGSGVQVPKRECRIVIRAWTPQADARGFVIVPLFVAAKLRLGASG